MRFLMWGDIVGRAGRQLLTESLQNLKKEWKIDFALVNADNASGGFGLIKKHSEELFQPNQNPPEIAHHVHRIVRDTVGASDPYQTAKTRSTAEAITLYPQLKQMVSDSVDPLDLALRISITGNMIDFGQRGFRHMPIENKLQPFDFGPAGGNIGITLGLLPAPEHELHGYFFHGMKAIAIRCPQAGRRLRAGNRRLFLLAGPAGHCQNTRKYQQTVDALHASLIQSEDAILPQRPGKARFFCVWFFMLK